MSRLAPENKFSEVLDALIRHECDTNEFEKARKTLVDALEGSESAGEQESAGELENE